MEKTYTRRKVINLLEKLEYLIQLKADLDMFYEVGYGDKKWVRDAEKELVDFSLDNFIKKHLK